MSIPLFLVSVEKEDCVLMVREFLNHQQGLRQISLLLATFTIPATFENIKVIPSVLRPVYQSSRMQLPKGEGDGYPGLDVVSKYKNVPDQVNEDKDLRLFRGLFAGSSRNLTRGWCYWHQEHFTASL